MDWIKSQIPFMHPKTKVHTFRFWVDRVHDCLDGKNLLEKVEEDVDEGVQSETEGSETVPFLGKDQTKEDESAADNLQFEELTEEDYLDVMELRLGGSYLQEMKDLRSQNWDLEYIEQHFLAKDFEREKEAMRKAAILEMTSKVERVIEMSRARQKELWGVSIGYNLSSEHGLQLLLGTVEPGSPAWKSGLRSGDTIVTVNDWTITLMDKPEVALHLFQASANTVRLGLISGTEDMTALGVHVY